MRAKLTRQQTEGKNGGASKSLHAVKSFAAAVFVLLLWQGIYEAGIRIPGLWKPYNFPFPLSVFKTLIQLSGDGVLPIAVLATLRRIIIGYSLSLLLGFAIGILTVKSKNAGKLISPLILGIQTLPSICWLPFAILWFGLNESAILFVTVMGSTFSVAISVESGFRNINPLYAMTARTMGAKGAAIYLHVIFPAALPGIISGMKQGWSFAWRALMAGEMLSATKGLGHVLIMGRELADINQVMAVMVIIALIGLLTDRALFGKLENEIRYKWGFGRSV